MNENPYKTQESDVIMQSEQLKNEYYVVSVKKFTILFFATMGAYLFYWFYKNWKEYKTYHGNNIWPIPRAIFAIFFIHNLFARVEQTLAAKEKSFDWKPSLLATAYVLVLAASILISIFINITVGAAFPFLSTLISLLVMVINYFLFVPPQKAINLSQEDPAGRNNDKLTPINYLWIAIGIIFIWATTLLSMVIPSI